MSYSEADVSAVDAVIEKYRAEADYEIGAALAVVGLSAERAHKEAAIRDDLIRVAHRVGASLRQLAEVSGLGRKTVTAIVEAGQRIDLEGSQPGSSSLYDRSQDWPA